MIVLSAIVCSRTLLGDSGIVDALGAILEATPAHRMDLQSERSSQH